MDAVDLLKQVPLFSDLEDRELQQIANGMKPRTFSAGQEIAVEGQSGVGFFVIEDGTAKVTVHGDEVRTLGPGDYFGEVALITEPDEVEDERRAFDQRGPQRRQRRTQTAGCARSGQIPVGLERLDREDP